MPATTQTPLTVNIFEAKTQLSKLIAMVENGEEVVIARAGKPVARLSKLEPEKPKIRFGGLKGKIWVADDFDAPLPPEILAEFEGDIFPREHPERPQAANSMKRARKS